MQLPAGTRADARSISAGFRAAEARIMHDPLLPGKCLGVVGVENAVRCSPRKPFDDADRVLVVVPIDIRDRRR